jgi:hypothetical protein
MSCSWVYPLPASSHILKIHPFSPPVFIVPIYICRQVLARNVCIKGAIIYDEIYVPKKGAKTLETSDKELYIKAERSSEKLAKLILLLLLETLQLFIDKLFDIESTSQASSSPSLFNLLLDLSNDVIYFCFWILGQSKHRFFP